MNIHEIENITELSSEMHDVYDIKHSTIEDAVKKYRRRFNADPIEALKWSIYLYIPIPGELKQVKI